MDGTRGLCCTEGCMHCCLSVSVRVIRLGGSGVFAFFFPCDVWSVSSDEVRPEEKGVARG